MTAPMDVFMRQQGWGDLSDDQRARLPNFFVIGAMRAGTTTLWQYLSRHPDVYASPVKEPHYFARAGEDFDPVHPDRALTREAYLALFDGVRAEHTIGEASPSYLNHPEVPARIRQVIEAPRFVAILRNPADRAFSSYVYRRAGPRERARTFAEAVELELAGNPDGERERDHLSRGYYGRQLARWFDEFERERFLVTLFDDLADDTSSVLRTVYAFLGVDANFEPGRVKAFNQRPAVRSVRLDRLVRGRSRLTPVVRRLVPRSVRRPIRAAVEQRNQASVDYPPELRRRIVGLYEEDVRLLERLLGRNLASWR